MRLPRRHMLPAIVVVAACLAVAGSASAAGPPVSLTVRAQSPESSRVLIYGRVLPAPRKGRIEAQIHRARGWKEFVSGRIKRGGGFRLVGEERGAPALR